MGNVNADLMRQTVDTIRENQDRWDQRQWIDLIDADDPACGTTLCFAGFAACLTGAEFVPVGQYNDGSYYQLARVLTDDGGEELVSDRAARDLGLDYRQADRIFYNTSLSDVDELSALVEQIIAEDQEG